MNPNFQSDIEAIQQIPAVQSILDIIRKTTGMGFAAVARVTDQRWVACAVNDGISFGLTPGGELELETTICHEIRQHSQPVIIDQVSTDTTYSNHRTPLQYGFESYISVPIVLEDGSFFGTLCAIDPHPAQLSLSHIQEMFQLFAKLIAQGLDKQKESKKLNEELRDERTLANLREQFIAIIGHDLRNPLTVSLAGAQALTNVVTDVHSKKISSLILSANTRMQDLLDNLMDFAESQLGHGITTKRNITAKVPQLLEQIVAEQQMLYPQAEIIFEKSLNEPINVDEKRITQLFSNLLINAIAHGKIEKPITITLSHTQGNLVLAVKNATDPISEERLRKMFQPYIRGENAASKGLGLGLFIASHISKAHAGTLTATYENGEIELTTSFPC